MTLTLVAALVVAAVLGALAQLAINLYSDALASRHPRISNLFKKRLLTIGIGITILIVIAAIVPAIISPSSSPKKDATGPGASPSHHPSGNSAPTRHPDTRSPSASSPKKPSIGTPKVRYSAEVTFNYEYEGYDVPAKDLDRVPVVDAEPEEGGDFAFDIWENSILPEGGATIAPWGKEKRPSYHDCAQRSAIGAVNSIDIKIGSTVCAHTNAGHVARMKVSKYFAAAVDNYDVRFDVTVWD